MLTRCAELDSGPGLLAMLRLEAPPVHSRLQLPARPSAEDLLALSDFHLDFCCQVPLLLGLPSVCRADHRPLLDWVARLLGQHAIRVALVPLLSLP